ncbi:DUF7507 domain-containing protein [Tundrisphaera sp. TA3]|uniref:DUF7507 domain-containing protein n=1 Tax=Tundrisphaera sp. TA3 TaxID=3435775 RepID=UPI003EB94B9E
MSRTGRTLCDAGRPARLAWPLLGLAIAAGLGSSRTARAQDVAPPNNRMVPVASTPILTEVSPPGEAVAGPAEPGVVGAAVLPHDVQVVRFHGPAGTKVEVLAPAPEPVPLGDGQGLATFGMKVGNAYHLRVSEIPDRPGAELFPVVEIVGHLHRPNGVDPGKYPIRIVLREDDITDAVDRGLMVTQVIYLEDPDLAIPVKLEKDDPPSVSLSPSEDPLRVARALGRVMAIARIGGRQPTPEELAGPTGLGLPNTPCPFSVAEGTPCGLPCGIVCGTPPPPGRPWMPKDEFLCDGGDRGEPVHFTGDGGLAGIDPRDAVVQFHDAVRPRVLPTNRICVYAPRFASVRVGIGASEALNALSLVTSEFLQRGEQAAMRQGPRRLLRQENAETSRVHLRATDISTLQSAGERSEVRVLAGVDTSTAITAMKTVQSPDIVRDRARAITVRQRIKVDALKTAEGPVMTGLIQSGGQVVVVKSPKEVAGVEEPPAKPGLAVVKLVDADEAEPGDILTYTIKFRNMGNVPLRGVSITDSLLPRLEYVPNSAQGPAKTVFTSGPNKAGALELRWDLPGSLAPGAEGSVTFRATVL